MKLYGFGRAGIAIFPINDLPEDGFAPIPLFKTEREVQDVIDARNAECGKGNIHVITYEVAT